MLPNFLIPIIGVIVVVLIALYGFTSRGYAIHAVLLATPIGIYLVNNPKALLILILGLYYSSLQIPGLPQGIQAVHALMVFFVLLTIARNIIAKPGGRRYKPPHLWLYGFLALLCVIIYFRGLGMRSAGSGLVGGASYIKLLFGAGFLFCAQYYTLSEKQWRNIIIFMLIGSTLQTISQLIFMLSGGKIYQHFMFVQPYIYGLVENMVGEAGAGTYRFHGLAGVSSQLLVTGLVFIPYKGTDKIKVAILVGVCLVMALMSGFRSNALDIFVVTIAFIVMSAPRGQKAAYALGVGSILAGVLLVAIPAMPYLPYPVQRALSWLPFADVSFLAQQDATGSAQWRLQVWKYSLSHWQDYMWLGRGFTFHMSEIQSLSVRADMILEAFITHNYHSGPISLLLDLGLPGFILGSCFLFSCARYSLKPLKYPASPFIVRAHIIFRVKLFLSVLWYYFIHGDVRSTFITIFINLVLLEAIQATAAALYKENNPYSVKSKPEVVFGSHKSKSLPANV